MFKVISLIFAIYGRIRISIYMVTWDVFLKNFFLPTKFGLQGQVQVQADTADMATPWPNSLWFLNFRT